MVPTDYTSAALFMTVLVTLTEGSKDAGQAGVQGLITSMQNQISFMAKSQEDQTPNELNKMVPTLLMSTFNLASVRSLSFFPFTFF
ncbi:unnamed protein product [Protopolystoma xenopodis]|uniref:Uncharacterized protein n=1 Tax=Protopolystoma xenopodis TaxID=117903 RepID=A0A448WUF4_9PLAT|nr:unnamed protein product [Protopolystoma xenopodis]